MIKKILCLFCFSVLIFTKNSFAQPVVCDTATIYSNTTSNAVCFEVIDNVRYCFSNNFPDHTDNFNQPPGFDIGASDEEYSFCYLPDTAVNFTPLYEEVETTMGCTDTYTFGILLNGVKLDPNSAVVWTHPTTGASNLDWHLEATSLVNSIGQGMGTQNGGHVNPFDEYHYHGLPIDYFTNDLGIDGTAHSPLVGYAADGLPIYYKYAYTDPLDNTSAIMDFTSGYTLRSGTRPGNGQDAPDGSYDGNYVEDYEFATGDLDECNGRYGITPDFPDGTYYYMLTENFPFIPRCFKGSVLDHTFRVGPAASCPSSSAATDCAAVIEGCMDPFASNYNAAANVDDGSCSYATGCEAGLVLSGNGSNSATSACEQDGFTFYEMTVGGGDYVMAINWDPTNIGGAHNATAKAAATVSVDKAPNYFSQTSGTEGAFMMRRFWNVDIGANTLDGAVHLRFYYDETEVTEIENAASAYASSNGSFVGSFGWAKNTSGTFTPMQLTTTGITNEIPLNDTTSSIANGISYVQLNNISSFSGGSGLVKVSAALPVELMNFKGKVLEKNNLLTWQTASESNTTFFAIERKLANRNVWEKIGTVEAAGNSNSTQTYRFEDGQAAGLNYYRLHIEDFDGSFEYSPIISLERNGNFDTPFSIFPNPSSGDLNLQVSKSTSEDLQVEIFSLTGELVHLQIFSKENFQNHCKITPSNNLQKGIYWIKITSPSKVIRAIERIIIQ